MAERKLLTDEQWAKIEPLLPKFKRSRKGGRKPAENRPILEGILWMLRTGARWQDLPKEYPSSSTCWRRLRDWKSRMSGSTFGVLFWANWMQKASWTGPRALPMAASPRPKRGALRRADQTRQGHEVDGGGRRPRSSSGEPPGLGQPGGSEAAGDDGRSDRGAAKGPWPPAEKSGADHRRQGL